MKKLFINIVFICYGVILWGQNYEQIITYENPVTDTFFEEYIVTDKYRLLEDLNDEHTINWIEKQNKVSKRYLSRVTNKTKSLLSIEQYSQVKYQIPYKKGKYYFTYAYYNNLNNPVLFCRTKFDDDNPQVLVDPNDISASDNIKLGEYSVSGDSKLLAYQYNRNGSDWAEVNVVQIKTGFHKKDHLTGLKFSNLEWKGDGFFYSTIKQENIFGKSLEQKVFYHQIGKEQSEDELIFERPNDPTRQFVYGTTSDEQFFILKDINERSGKFSIFYIDYNSDNQQLKPLLTNLPVDIDLLFLDSQAGKFIAWTSLNSNNGKIVEIDPSDPYNWRTIADDFDESILVKAIPTKDRIIAVYLKNQQSILTVIDYTGKLLYTLEFPVGTSLERISGEYADEEFYLGYESYTFPPVVYKFNIRNYQREVTRKTDITYRAENIEYKEIEYKSKDGVYVPMIIAYEKGIKLDGNNPTLLKAYGGFGTVTQPSFDPGIVYFIKKGGIFAFASIRGGGDKGHNWALDGKGLNKQKSFDDFIAASEFLIDNNYTNPSKLAITGGSNGGLVVAAAAIQRPDLFKVVVPIAAPLDMIRFENFTVGHWHTDEYGTVNEIDGFKNLYNYSPYHNIDNNVNYPAMLVIASENDDRVPPFHSFKFVASLQNRNAQLNPIILKVNKKSGHSSSGNWYSSIKQKAEIYGFIINILNP